MSKYHHYYGYYKKRPMALEVITAVFFGFFLYFATLIGNIASFYLNRIFS
jgi:hypothetical protein